MSSDDEGTDRSRRGFMAALVGIAALIGYGTGSTAAQEAENNVGTADDPYDVVYVDRIRFIDQGDDPSDLEDGTIWYNGDA